MTTWEEIDDLPLDRAPLAFVDVETTGLRAEGGDRICEVGVAVYRGGEEVFTFASLVNPGRPISPGAAAVNGLSDDLVRDAPSFAAVASEVAAALALGFPVAHNAPFDLSFLAYEFARAGLPPAAQGSLDTLALARRLFPFGRHSLSSLARTCALPQSGAAHRALADALTARALLIHLGRLAGRGQPPTIGALLAVQGGPVPWPATAPVGALPLPAHLAGLIEPGRRLRIRYVDFGGEVSVRTVELSEVYASGGAVYAAGFCQLRGAQRTFRIDRIVSCEPA